MIKILGSSGNKTDKFQTTCIQVSDHTVIDAGNIIFALKEEAKKIDNILLTHSHIDHILDCAFLCDNFFDQRVEPLKIYALKETIQTLQEHMFNWKIWPDFTSLTLLKSEKKALEFIEVDFDKSYEVDNIRFTPIKANHTVPCCGYLIEKEGSGVLFSGDTYKNDKLWEVLNNSLHVKSLIVDISFPSRLEELAKASKHLTPLSLQEELKKLKRDDVTIYINHIKSGHVSEIASELYNIGLNLENILYGGEVIDIRQPKLLKQTVSVNHIERIQLLNKIGTELSVNRELSSLLDMIVSEAKNLTNADAGTLYLFNKEKLVLDFTIVQTDSLGIHLAGKAGDLDWPSVPLYHKDGRKNFEMVASTCALKDEVINIEDVYETVDFNFEGTKKFDISTGYRSKSMLVIPLKNHEKKIIGVLQLLNKTDMEKVVAFNEEDEEITLSLASQAAVAITNTNLIEDLENLLESFLRSIIYAIRKKSTYTSNHINKMVALSKMIAKAVNEDEGFYKEKTFSVDELKQINFAALMHDVGKLSTPDYILDKATKLDGLNDNIEVIKTRAWAIKKEIEVAYLKKEMSKVEFENNIKKIDKDLALLVKSNEGSEFLPDEVVKEINSIAQYPFTCNNQKFYLITEEEAKLLTIQKGTLTTEEKNIINEHAKISIDILNKLPFPDKYKNIPSISGNHHEKINGKGYPSGLKGDEISFEARILAIADIFEALTASDRPYKKANNLSTAMKILFFMAKDDDLDRDLVKFFYNSGLYKEFAKKSLKAEQIDEVDVDFSSL